MAAWAKATTSARVSSRMTWHTVNHPTLNFPSKDILCSNGYGHCRQGNCKIHIQSPILQLARMAAQTVPARLLLDTV